MALLGACSLRTDVLDAIQRGSKPVSTPLLEVAAAQASTCTSVRVTFSSGVEKTSAETAANYSIPGLSVTGAVRDGANSTIVDLATVPQAGDSYTLTVTGVRGTDGRTLGFHNSAPFTGDAAPFLQGAGSSNENAVVVYFSEEVDLSSAQTAGNYIISDGVSCLTVHSASRDPVILSRVNLVTEQQKNTTYTLTASGVRDLTGNSLTDPFSASFTGTAPADTTPPAFLGAALADGDTLEVRFSEPMDQATSENESNYDIRDGSGNPIPAASAVRQADQSIVWVGIEGYFSKSAYTVTVGTNVKDVELNALAGPPGNVAAFPGLSTHILSAAASAANAVKVRFSHEVEETAAETVSNHTVPGLTILGAARDTADHALVTLATSPHKDINYTLTVGGFIDVDSEGFAGDVSPCLRSVNSYGNTQILVRYSEAVDPTSAQSVANYAISPSLTIVSASLDPSDPSRVLLVTGAQSGGTTYTLSVSGVKDLTGNPLVSPASLSFKGTSASDATPPALLSACLADGDTVEVCFSEPMDQVSSETETYYSLKDGAGNTIAIAAATRQSELSKVWLDTGSLLTQGLYTLVVSTSVKDVKLNALLGFPRNTVYFIGGGAIPESLGDGPVLTDPFDSAPDFGMLAEYRGWIYLGPASADNAVYRMKPDGSAAELVTFLFHKGGTTTTSLSPGPDGEDGIDCFAAGVLNGTEYLVFGPAKSSGVNYLYYTSEYGVTLNFTGMYLGSELGSYTVGVSAMNVWSSRLYVGLPDTVLVKPYLLKILNLVPSPAVNVDYVNLDGGYLPRIGSFGSPSNGAGKVGIDSFGVHGGRLFVANGGNAAMNDDGGIVASTTTNPRSANTYPGDWQDKTPTGLADWYDPNDRFSKELSKTNKLTPADRAFPSMAVWNGCLYAARNTTGWAGGPQLWRWDGSSWDLVAPNGSGITNMGDPGNTSVSMLVANGDRLYIGYDNVSTGVQVWRTRSGVTYPLAPSDFEPVDTGGFGKPATNLQIYHALSAQCDGVDYLWLLCGKPGETLRVYRTKN